MRHVDKSEAHRIQLALISHPEGIGILKPLPIDQHPREACPDPQSTPDECLLLTPWNWERKEMRA